MGGAKKKSISQSERAQSVSSKGSEKKDKQDLSTSKVIEYSTKIPEQQVIKSLAEIKAITTYGTARALNVNASIASSILKDLETKGLVSRTGGYSGHYIYRMTTKG